MATTVRHTCGPGLYSNLKFWGAKNKRPGDLDLPVSTISRVFYAGDFLKDFKNFWHACLQSCKQVWILYATTPPHSLILHQVQVIDHQLFTVDIKAFSLQLLHRFIEQLLNQSNSSGLGGVLPTLTPAAYLVHYSIVLFTVAPTL